MDKVNEVVEFVWIPNPSWGSDYAKLPHDHEEVCKRAESWIERQIENKPKEKRWFRVSVRPSRGGEGLGIYERTKDGNLQILGYSISIPSEVDHIISRAWDYVVSTL